MILTESLREQAASVIARLDAALPRLWDMVGLAIWACEPPVCTRLELQYIRSASCKVLYFAPGIGGPQQGQGIEAQLTRRVHRPEDYTGAYLGGGGDVKLRGVGYGIGGATGFPWGPDAPVGVSIGLSSPGISWWLCDYQIVGKW